MPFTLAWHASYRPPPAAFDGEEAVRETAAWWEAWTGRCTYDGRWRDAVVRSLATLKALVYAPTGGIVAAPTTSLPEQLGGVRNWDSRCCWLRDATFTLYALMIAGYVDDAAARRLCGNVPQAFSHLALVSTARNLTRAGGPAEERRR